MTIEPDVELEKTISDLIKRKMEIENRILSAHRMGLSSHIIDQLITMKDNTLMDLDYCMGIKRHAQESSGEDDTDGLIV